MSPSNAHLTDARLAKLRVLMKGASIDALYIPSADAHSNEYISPSDARRAYISGFTGSAGTAVDNSINIGTAVVTDSEAALWTDGRYFLQAGKQLDANWKLMKQGLPATPSMSSWLLSVLPAGAKVGVDAQTISYESVLKLRDALAKRSVTLVPTKENLVDAIWEGRPRFVAHPVFHLPVKYSGEGAVDKLSSVRKALQSGDEPAAALLVTALDEVAWLFNLRGSDIPFNPVFFAYAVVTASDVSLYLFDPAQLDEEARKSLPAGVQVRPYGEFIADMTRFGASLDAGRRVMVDSSCNWAIVEAIGAEKVRVAPSPVEAAKAVKNEVELDGLRRCHIRDAAALCNFFGWLEHELAAKNVISECDAAERLEALRAEQASFVGLSFDTISSAGPNAAIIHYKPEESTCARITVDQIFLLDSGGQYLDGTTDVTRTMHFGEPTAHQRDCFTRVLLGNLNVERAIFPTGTTGFMLDSTARMPLWQAGLDYAHGTGHGVGHFLNVHEGPHSISFHIRSNATPLKPGMTITNEPGYYEDGAFGIRIENVLLVREARPANNFRDTGFLGFENITMVPIQAKLIDRALLDPVHVDMLNRYHEECWRKVSPLLSEGSLGRAWLERNVKPIV